MISPGLERARFERSMPYLKNQWFRRTRDFQMFELSPEDLGQIQRHRVQPEPRLTREVELFVRDALQRGRHRKGERVDHEVPVRRHGLRAHLMLC